jgi:hypothetical protein
MSVAVDLDALAERVAEYGARAYLLTVTDDQTPHAVSVHVELHDGRLVTSVGRTTGANLAQRPTVTLLWPPSEPAGEYSLIVDGAAVGPVGEGEVSFEPTAAVLHRVADAAGDGPSCIRVATA